MLVVNKRKKKRHNITPTKFSPLLPNESLTPFSPLHEAMTSSQKVLIGKYTLCSYI